MQGNAPLIAGYEAIEVGRRKSGPSDYLANDRELASQIDELQRISSYERDKFLGREYFTDIEDFYNLEDSQGSAPMFRPQVRVPQLQTLMLNEATDLSDSSPKIYISSQGDGSKAQRDKEREHYFQANWRQGCFNNRISEAVLWAMLSNLGFLQVGYNPRARRGKGATWLEMRHPKSVYPDPYAKSDADWSYVIMEDWMYVDEVWRIWPDKGHLVRPRLFSEQVEPFGDRPGPLEFPEYSPLSQQGGTSRKIFRDNRVRVRHCYLFDNTREAVREYAGSKTESDLLVHPRFQYAYPDGRWITECEGVILADGNNWCPQLPDDDRGTFPLVRVPAMPCITNFWGPPPVRLTRGLQRLGERVYTQIFENFVRLNNGVIVIKNNSGLDPTSIGWLPGEVLQINQGADPPQVISPQPLPQQAFSTPATLFSLQKELQGFSESRQGSTGSGNMSPELFDAALWASKPMTRLRGRLLAESLQRLSAMTFYIMQRYQVMGQSLPEIQDGELVYRTWQPGGSLDDYDVHLDEGSLQVMSGTMMRSVVSALAKSNLLPTKAVLESAGIPNAGEIAEERTRELELAAMSKLRKPR